VEGYAPHAPVTGVMTAPQPPAGTGVAVVLGTRPEIVKLAPVIHELGALAHTVFTGQHYDADLSDAFFASCQLPAPDMRLTGVGGRPRTLQLLRMIEQLHERFLAHRPAAVIVQGDTNSANAGAQAAHYLGIPVVHVGAGLRSHDRNMPEEINRLVIGAVADVHCCATPRNAKALLDAGTPPEAIHVTGNTIVEATRAALPCRTRRLEHVHRFGLEPGGFALSTMHRPENTDDEDRLQAILGQLGMLGMPVLLPLHPRTRHHIEGAGLFVPDTVITVPPVDHPTFLSLADECRVVVSDSGGVQEEVTVLGRPLVVVRNSTERPEAIEAGFALLSRPADILHSARRLLDPRHLARLRATPSPYGDGLASERIALLAAHAAGAELVRTGSLLDELAAF
jgi:UDP-N-acetylglucosamine 2-epimerase (non-hydrolysing)